MVAFYNDQVKRSRNAVDEAEKKDKLAAFEAVIDTDPKQIAWSGNLKNDGVRGTGRVFHDTAITAGTYRPFVKGCVYFDRSFNERVYQLPQIFPEGRLPNVVIAVDSRGSTKEFSTLVVNTLPDYECISKGQCFPLYLYEKADDSGKLDLGKDDGEIIDGYRRRDAITDAILKTFREAYGNDYRRVGPAAHRRAGPPSLDANCDGGPALEASLSHPTTTTNEDTITKEDIFYYVYGVLHSPEYRTRFAADLKKMLPRIPLTQETNDFRAFSTAGRELAKWHLNYETVEPWPLAEHMDRFDFDSWEQFHVQEM
jgi:predicted helicase